MRIAKCLLIVSVVALMGCSQGPRYCPHCGVDLTSPAPAKTGADTPMPAASTVTVYKMSPAKLFEIAQQAIKDKGLTITMAASGVIQTDWKSYEGEFHIARRWQEQTRYRVSIIPDVNDPVNHSRFEVGEETQRRSNERAQWSSAEGRPQRVKEIREAIAAKASEAR